MQFKTVKFEFKKLEDGALGRWSNQRIEEIRDFIESQIESDGAELFISPDVHTVLMCGNNKDRGKLIVDETPADSAVRYGYLDFGGEDNKYMFILDLYAVNEKAEDDNCVIIRHDNGLIKVLDFSGCLFTGRVDW